MKKPEDAKEMYAKVVGLQNEIKDTLQSYIEKENIDISNYVEELDVQFNEVAEYIFNRLNNGKSENMNYLIDHMENLDGDAQIISAFVRAYITDQIIVEIVSFEEFEEVGNMAKFYFFYQNNSGGSFDVDDNVAEYVIIEANNHHHANDRAEGIGIYFNGCAIGTDCRCCGDRWHSHWDDSEATDTPTIFNTPIKDYEGSWMDKEYRIHYLDGRVEKGVLKAK